MSWRRRPRKPLPPADKTHLNRAITLLQTAVNQLKELQPK